MIRGITHAVCMAAQRAVYTPQVRTCGQASHKTAEVVGMHLFVCFNVTIMMHTCDVTDYVYAGNVDAAGDAYACNECTRQPSLSGGVDSRVGVGSTLKGLSPAIGFGWLLYMASQ